MKKLKLKFVLAAVFSAFSIAVNAQKLPGVQKVSIRAPANIKIDGNATEWGNQFQAYNHATDLFYSMANDDDNLYLIMRATKPRIIQKILAVGIGLTINNTGKRDSKATGNRSITYPVISYNDGSRIVRYTGLLSVNARKGLSEDTVNMITDSLLVLANQTLAVSSKFIEINGLAGIPDTLISVYNDHYIKTAQLFDKKQFYTYELCIPLKSLGLSVDHSPKFSYNIKLISRFEAGKGVVRTMYRYSSDNPDPIDMNPDLDATTDFWGEYTLAKK